jgi:manganese/zinc/iron transport system permease protein
MASLLTKEAFSFLWLLKGLILMNILPVAPVNSGWRRTFFLLLALLALLVVCLLFALSAGAQFDHTLTTVALGGALLGWIVGAIGVFSVLRGQSLMGDVLSHAALPGVVIAYLIAGRQPLALLIGAGVSGWLGSWLVLQITRSTRIKQDGAMGIVLTTFFAVGIVLLSYVQRRGDAGQAGLDKFIFGQAAAIVQGDVILIGVVGVLLLLCLVTLWKEFKLIVFDPEYAKANGYPVVFLSAALSTLVAIAIVLGLQLAGVILMVGLLIAPAAAARQWTHHLAQMVLLAAAFGAFSGSVGSVLSGVGQGLPTGPLIIVVSFFITFVSVLAAPGRGVIALWWQRRAERSNLAAPRV